MKCNLLPCLQVGSFGGLAVLCCTKLYYTTPSQCAQCTFWLFHVQFWRICVWCAMMMGKVFYFHPNNNLKYMHKKWLSNFLSGIFNVIVTIHVVVMQPNSVLILLYSNLLVYVSACAQLHIGSFMHVDLFRHEQNYHARAHIH